MNEADEIREVLEELIAVLHTQAEEMNRLTEHVEKHAGRLPQPNQLTVVASDLAKLHRRVRELKGGAAESSST